MRQRPAAELSWETVRRGCNMAAAARGEWAGAPIPLDGLKLVVEPRYPFQGLQGFALPGIISAEKSAKQAELKDANDGLEYVNSWYHHGRNQRVVMYREHGKVKHFVERVGGVAKRYHLALDCMLPVGTAWTLAAEQKAMQKLKREATPRAFECYSLTGTFVESSPRSGIAYVFRRLRPTLALGTHRHRDGSVSIIPIAALCMHPIGYYEGTFVGVMVPTDDVLAHLLMMRGDEHGYWKKANQHSLWEVESGL